MNGLQKKRNQVLTIVEGKSMTQQHFKGACDINNILKKFQRTGKLEHVNHAQGVYGDFSDGADFQSSMEKLINAQNMFEQLDSKIRKKFNNNPAQLIDYVQNLDMKNKEAVNEAVALGIINKPIEANTAPVLNEGTEVTN